MSKGSLVTGGEDVLFLCGLTVEFSGIVESKLSWGNDVSFSIVLMHCAVCLAALLACSTGSKGHVNMSLTQSMPLSTPKGLESLEP